MKKNENSKTINFNGVNISLNEIIAFSEVTPTITQKPLNITNKEVLSIVANEQKKAKITKKVRKKKIKNSIDIQKEILNLKRPSLKTIKSYKTLVYEKFKEDKLNKTRLLDFLQIKEDIKKDKFMRELLTKRFFYSNELITIRGEKPFNIDNLHSKEEKTLFNQRIDFYSKIEQEKILSDIKAKKKYDKNIKRLNKRKFKKLIDDINLLSNVGLSHLVRQLNFKSIVTRKLKKYGKIK
jgi:hypothetical protein